MTAKRLPWGHESRHCVRCGKVGPRINDVTAGWVHYYCLTDEEKRRRRAADRETRRAALAKAQGGRE